MKKRIDLQKLLCLAREEGGAELVEFALSSLMLICLMFGVFNWMVGMYVYHFTTFAAQQGTRFAAVRGYTWSKNVASNCLTSAPPSFTMPFDCTASSTDIQNYVKSLATAGINPSSVTINTTTSSVWPGQALDGATVPCTAHPNNPGCVVKITVTYSFNFLPFMKLTAFPMTASSEKVILQ